MSGKGSRPPAPPDPTQTARAQTESNRDTAIANSYLNNVNQNTPYGSVNWSVSGYGPNGIPRWQQNVTESGNQQQLRELSEQQGIELGQLGLEQTGRVSDILGSNYVPRRFDTNAATGGALDIAGALGDYGGDVEARTRELAQRGLGRDFDRREESLRSRLAAQGINAGTEAFGSELQGLGEQRGDAFARAELMARDTARADRGQMLSELLGQRGTNLSEARDQYGLDTTADLAARQNPLNEIIALMSGVQTNPINPGQPNQYGIAGTDVAGIHQSNYANQMAGWQAQQSQQNGLLGALANLGGAAMSAGGTAPWFLSDRRLKRDAELLGADDRGNRIWRYAYLWDEPGTVRFGVMADEAPAHAVALHSSGYLMVNYSALP